MAETARRELMARPLPGYDPEIGTWLWALEDVRRRYTLRFVDGLDQRTLDWEGPDGRENAIGTLVYHIADVELGWLFYDVLLQTDLPEAVKPDFPYPARGPDGRLTPVLGVPLDVHLGRLERSRRLFLETFRDIPPWCWLAGASLRSWRRAKRPAHCQRRDLGDLGHEPTQPPSVDLQGRGGAAGNPAWSAETPPPPRGGDGGDEGSRTPDPLRARQVLSR